MTFSGDIAEMTVRGTRGYRAREITQRGCAENYIRVVVTSRGVKTAELHLPTPSDAIPTARYTYHVYLPLILHHLYIFSSFASSSYSSSTRNILLIYYIILYYIILYYIILYYIILYLTKVILNYFKKILRIVKIQYLQLKYY